MLFDKIKTPFRFQFQGIDEEKASRRKNFRSLDECIDQHAPV